MPSLARGPLAAPAPLLVRLLPLGPLWARGLTPLVKSLQVTLVLRSIFMGFMVNSGSAIWPLGQLALLLSLAVQLVWPKSAPTALWLQGRPAHGTLGPRF